MAVKSVIDVEVNDEAFVTFKALFDRYKEQVAEMPGAWGEVDKAVGGVSATFGDVVAAMMAQATFAEALEKHERKRANEAERTSRAFKGLSIYSKDIAKNVAGATTQLLKWVSLTGVFSGLLGFGGLYGIDRLALNAASGRRSSLGLGIGYGEQKAFETDFGRIVDPAAFLSGVAESLHDVTKRWTLTAAGVPSAAIATGNAGAVGASLLSSVKTLVDRTPSNQLQQLSDARGLGQFFSIQDLIRLKATPQGELAAQAGAYSRDARSFGLSDSTTLAWQNFATQLTRAGQKIENVFVRGLTPLTPALSALSDSFAKAVETLLVSPRIKDDLAALGKGLESFAGYVASDKFQSNVKTLGTNLVFLGEKVISALRFFGFLPEPEGPPTSRETSKWNATHPDERKPYANKDSILNDDPNRPFKWYDPGSYFSKNGGVLFNPEAKFFKDKNLTLALIRQLEGSGDAEVSKPQGGGHGGAVGRYQIMPADAKALGIDPKLLTDPAVSKKAAGMLIDDIKRQGARTLDELLVGYNSTPKYLKKFVASGDDPRVLMPETQKYLAHAHRILHVPDKAGGKVPDHSKTLRELIASLEGKADAKKVERDVEAVAKAVGLKPTSQINVNDASMMRKLDSSLKKVAAAVSAPKPASVVVKNNTGGNAVVVASQVAR